MTRNTTDVLAHFGVKGMKWGVRNDRGHEGERVKTKKLAKLDKKFEKEHSGIHGFIKMNNAVAERINPRLDEMNAKPEYAGDITKDPVLHKKYQDEYTSHLRKSIEEANSTLGLNPSGSKRATLTMEGEGYDATWKFELKDVQHADGTPAYVGDGFLVIPEFDKTGKIVGQKVVPLDAILEHWDVSGHFLEHYGVKGMKWGVHRSEKTAQEVTTKTAPGRKVKAAGGKHHSPSEDAIKAARIRQQAKKSTTDSLSNKELQELIQRMNLEAQYQNLNQNNVSSGKKLLRFLTGQVGDKEVNQLSDFASDSRGKTTTDKKGKRVNDPKTAFAVKAGVAGAKAIAGGKK